MFLDKNLLCDPSLEPSYQDGSKEGSHCMFSLRISKIILELSSIPLLIRSSVKLQASARKISY